jgi:hypothetical protein
VVARVGGSDGAQDSGEVAVAAPGVGGAFVVDGVAEGFGAGYVGLLGRRACGRDGRVKVPRSASFVRSEGFMALAGTLGFGKLRLLKIASRLTSSTFGSFTRLAIDYRLDVVCAFHTIERGTGSIYHPRGGGFKDLALGYCNLGSRGQLVVARHGVITSWSTNYISSRSAAISYDIVNISAHMFASMPKTSPHGADCQAKLAETAAQGQGTRGTVG